jgi:hypothetical protein
MTDLIFHFWFVKRMSYKKSFINKIHMEHIGTFRLLDENKLYVTQGNA